MQKNLKILLIANTSNFFKNFMLNHIKKLSKKYEVTICCNNVNELKKIIPRNVSLYEINFRRGFNLFHDFFVFFYTIILFFKIKPSLSISFTPKIGLMVALASFISRTPKRIHWFTGQIWATRQGLGKIFFKFIDKFIFSLSNNVLVDGLSQYSFLIREKVITVNRSEVLHKGSVGGVNIKKFKMDQKRRTILRKDLSISKNTFVFLYLGRINEDKGIIELVKAFNEFSKNKDVLLIFVGSIEDKKFFKILKNKKKILYFNFSKEPKNWFLLSDILCLPSRREGFGTVVIEAASCNLPALCSNIYGLKDAIVNHKTGFFHKVRNSSDIKKKMLYTIKNKALIRNFGKLGRKRVVKDFHQDILTEKFIKFINLNLS